MKGLYLYCIKQKSIPGFSAPGIDGDKAQVLPYQDLEAVVSEVFLEKFDSEEIKHKARQDLNWIKEKAQVHEIVIEQAMRQENGRVVPVIPMKFGTIFKTKEKLEETLGKHYSQFKESLETLARKQEWTVKVYLNHEIFREEIKKVSPQAQEKEKEIAQLPEGMAYFMQKQIDGAISKEVDQVLERYTQIFFEDLKEYAQAGTRGKILEKELTGKFLPMVLNAIFLVSEGKLKDFIKEVDKLNKRYSSEGFTFDYSGPWPPYNFIPHFS